MSFYVKGSKKAYREDGAVAVERGMLNVECDEAVGMEADTGMAAERGEYDNNDNNNNNNKIDASGVKRLIPCMSFCS